MTMRKASSAATSPSPSSSDAAARDLAAPLPPPARRARIVSTLDRGRSSVVARAAWDSASSSSNSSASSSNSSDSGASSSAGRDEAGGEGQQAQALAQPAQPAQPLSLETCQDGALVSVPASDVLFYDGASAPGGEFALKIVHVPTVNANAAALAESAAGEDEGIQREISILRHLGKTPARSPFVVDFYFASRNASHFFIGMEPCLCGDLFALMQDEDLQATDVLFYASEIALGLQFLHENNILHADIKPENIGLTSSGHVRILDFGLSVLLDPLANLNTDTGRLEVKTCSGTLAYAAPEVLMREAHGFESDWWSLGIVIFEMVFGGWPWFIPDDPQETCNLICVEPLQFPQGYESNSAANSNNDTTSSSDEDDHGAGMDSHEADAGPHAAIDVHAPWHCAPLLDLIARLLVKEPSARITWENGLEDLKIHPFFDGIDWDCAALQGYVSPFAL